MPTNATSKDPNVRLAADAVDEPAQTDECRAAENRLESGTRTARHADTARRRARRSVVPLSHGAARGRDRDLRRRAECRHRAERGDRRGPRGGRTGLHDRRRLDGAATQSGGERSIGSGTGVPGRHREHRRLHPGDRLTRADLSTSNCCVARRSEPTGSGTSIASERVQIGADGEIVPVSFEIEPDAPGRFVYQIRAAAPPEDDNPRDNGRESEMDVVDRQTRVLLMASGPTREYRFLRDQLHRDHTMKTDVLLQTAQSGMSQDADNILSEFPSTRDELYQYDCIVAFDPDWTQLDAAQVELLEKWIADEAGGLIAVPGPIHTAEWVRSVEHAKLRDLYPVVFQQRLTLLDDGHFGGESAYPLVFERAGRDARFLWLANSAEESELAWTSFPGVFGYYAIKGEKPGATVYARVADPEAGTGDKLPVYMAGQFYGAGQVLYIGSGEFWRLRALDPGYFETLFTKLVRQVSQGRLLRGSSRGTLLVDRDRYELGETVVLRGRLSDERHEPLTVESVTAQVVRPDNSTDTVKLTADAQQPGMYIGQFVGPPGRNVSSGAARARQPGRAVLEIHSSPRARPGTRPPGTQRAAAHVARQGYGRALLPAARARGLWRRRNDVARQGDSRAAPK